GCFQTCAFRVAGGQIGEDFVCGSTAGFDLVSGRGEGDALAEHGQGHSTRQQFFLVTFGLGRGALSVVLFATAGLVRVGGCVGFSDVCLVVVGLARICICCAGGLGRVRLAGVCLQHLV